MQREAGGSDASSPKSRPQRCYSCGVYQGMRTGFSGPPRFYPERCSFARAQFKRAQSRRRCRDCTRVFKPLRTEAELTADDERVHEWREKSEITRGNSGLLDQLPDTVFDLICQALSRDEPPWPSYEAPRVIIPQLHDRHLPDNAVDDPEFMPDTEEGEEREEGGEEDSDSEEDDDDEESEAEDESEDALNFAVGSHVDYGGFAGCTVAVLHADGSVDINIPGVGRMRVARSAVRLVRGGQYEVARKQCDGDGKTYSMRQENKISGYGRAVRRTPLTPGQESRVPLYNERLAVDVESRKKEADLAQQARVQQAHAQQAHAQQARAPTFIPDPSAPPSTPAPAPAPAPAPGLWNRLWDLLAQPSSAPAAPASGPVNAGGGAPPASGVRPGGWPAHGVLLTGLSSAVLKDAESRLAAALTGALKRSEEPLSLAACDGPFPEKMAALRAALQKAGADAVEDNVVLQTVRVSALGERGVSRGEKEVLMWVAQSVAAARDREAENGLVKFPDEWEGGPFDASTTGMRLVPVASGSREYQEVCRRFMFRPDSSPPAFPNAVLSVERVQNPMAYASYDKWKKVIAAKGRNNGNPNELWMKHGTRLSDPVAIISGEEGLDFRYCDSGMFGRGTYLAEDAAYSARGYAYKKSSTAHQMLLVRVAAGTIFESQPHGHRHPPSGYDSVRGVVATDNKAVIVYNVSQVYPAYLITYTP